MALIPGVRLGHYEILAPLGAGGMGEVYRARDTRLGREVALKLLPPAFAEDPDRLARLEQEAKLLASLSHPGLATLYGLEELEGRRVLVMERVEGEDLAQRLKRGAMPVGEALEVARQVAEALEAAHDRGIVHRDLKPANVMLTPEGRARVVDFGLAKAWTGDSGEASPTDLSRSPTLANSGTLAGVILGTAAYMSPEQASGRPVDRRTDVWAFGALVFEMLTGRPIFSGETASEVLAAVLKDEPDWSRLPKDLPSGVGRLLRHCLRKKPRERTHDMGDVRLEIEEALAGSDGTESASAALRLPWGWLAAGGAAVALAAFVAGGLVARPRPDTRTLAFEVNPPEGALFNIRTDAISSFALSPDGRMLAFTATAGKRVSLHVRSLDATAARAVPGTEGAQYPFWSPDSRQLGFFAGGKLQRVDVAGGGGAPVVLCGAPDVKGASWSPAGVIVFAPDAGVGLSRVSDQGGEPQPLTRLDALRKENSHRHPRFLPDGRHFLYLARLNETSERAVMVGSLDGSPPRELLRSPAVAEFASGHLLYLKGVGGAHRRATSTLMAQPFGAERLAFQGEAFPLADDVTLIEGNAYVGPESAALGGFSVSSTGTVAYHLSKGATTARRLVWRDTEGREIGSLPGVGEYRHVRISPRGDLALLNVEARPAGGSTVTGSYVDDHTANDLYVLDLERNVSSRLTLGPRGGAFGIWAPDGQSVVFSCDIDGYFDLCRQRLSESEPEVLLRSKIDKAPQVISPDGRTLGFGTGGVQGENADTWLLPLEGKSEPRPWLKTAFWESLDAISPDGRFAAYTSEESGRIEVYVTSFPRPGKKWRVSTEGGIAADWQADGRRLYYYGGEDGRTVFGVDIDTRGGEIRVGTPKALFSTAHRGAQLFAPAPDSRRILSIEPVPTAPTRDVITVVVNWPARRAGSAAERGR